MRRTACTPGGRRGQRHAGGFTLLEVQVVLVLTVLTVGIAFTALHLVSRSWAAGSAALDASEDAAHGIDALRRLVAGALPLVVGSGRSPTAAFAGDADRIAFHAELPSHRGTGGPYRLEIRYRPEAQDLWLAYSIPGGVPSNAGVTVLRDVRQARFAYAGPGAEPLWNDQWSGRPDLPALVRLHLDTVGRREGIDVVMPIHARIRDGQPYQRLVGPP